MDNRLRFSLAPNHQYKSQYNLRRNLKYKAPLEAELRWNLNNMPPIYPVFAKKISSSRDAYDTFCCIRGMVLCVPSYWRFTKDSRGARVTLCNIRGANIFRSDWSLLEVGPIFPLI